MRRRGCDGGAEEEGVKRGWGGGQKRGEEQGEKEGEKGIAGRVGQVQIKY